MARDLFHQAVKEALEKDGWTITDDPYYIRVTDSSTYAIDLGAEKILAAEKGNQKIAVEVKSFISPSLAYEFHLALGQYLNYSTFIEIQEPNRKLYLAISNLAYKNFFLKESTEIILNKFNIKIIIVDMLNHVIREWVEK